MAKHGPFILRMRRSATWILRRSLAGVTTGFVGWVVSSFAARAAGGAELPQWGHMLLSGAIGGYFLGLVEGMVEDSTAKTIRGGVLGALGGLLGGVAAFIAIQSSTSGNPAIIAGWGVTGAIIGMSSVWLEKRASRILMGLVAGFAGGALGGWLGYQMYFSLVDMIKPETWILLRTLEGTTGAVLGAVMWFVVGSTEKLLIFKRRIAINISYKECDRCQHINLLKAWYCAGCGALLQVAAPPEKLQWSKREALTRVVAACQFLAQLSAMTGAAIAFLMLFFLSTINFFLALFGLLATSLVSYLLHTAFYAVSDFLAPLLESSSPSSVRAKNLTPTTSG